MEKINTKLTLDQLRPLMLKKDLPGLLRACVHLGLIGIFSFLTIENWGSWSVIPFILVLGYLEAFLFTAEHECAHHTAFKSHALNDLLGHFSGFLLLLPYEYYRVYHWDHHRYTQDPQRDPELVSMPLPSTYLGLFMRFSNISIWGGRIKMLCKHALFGEVTAPWVPDNKKALIVREARLYFALYCLLALTSALFSTILLLKIVVIPVCLGQLFLRPYLLAEHAGCDETPVNLENTRTTYTNTVVRFFAWNMPFHAEHHAYPAVPFHGLPALNSLIKNGIKHTANGYPAATRETVRFLMDSTRK